MLECSLVLVSVAIPAGVVTSIAQGSQVQEGNWNHNQQSSVTLRNRTVCRVKYSIVRVSANIEPMPRRSPRRFALLRLPNCLKTCKCCGSANLSFCYELWLTWQWRKAAGIEAEQRASPADRGQERAGGGWELPGTFSLTRETQTDWTISPTGETRLWWVAGGKMIIADFCYNKTFTALPVTIFITFIAKLPN